MRTVKRWKILEERIVKKIFPPRIAHELIALKRPKGIEGKGMFLYSESGSGKTLFAGWCLLEFMKRGYLKNETPICGFINMSELIHNLKKGFDNNSKAPYTEIMEQYQNLDFLILDDLGVVKMSEWVYEVIYLLINYRYENYKPTIYTSNFSLQELTEIFGDDRLVTRIQRSGGVFNKKHWKL